MLDFIRHSYKGSLKKDPLQEKCQARIHPKSIGTEKAIPSMTRSRTSQVLALNLWRHTGQGSPQGPPSVQPSMIEGYNTNKMYQDWPSVHASPPYSWKPVLVGGWAIKKARGVKGMSTNSPEHFWPRYFNVPLFLELNEDAWEVTRDHQLSNFLMTTPMNVQHTNWLTFHYKPSYIDYSVSHECITHNPKKTTKGQGPLFQ
jgi:hypothetical protein